MIFRKLKASEIDCRVAQISNKGLSLLLYKDARVDMTVLDETVGPMNWQRIHSRENRNCTIQIWDAQKGQWISKEDTGTESNTEAEKGLASDSFKRAGVNWGIGRELYTAPFIWIPASACAIVEGRNGKPACYDGFKVTEIDYDATGAICRLEITNQKSGSVVYQMVDAKKASAQLDPVKVKALKAELKAQGISEETVCRLYKVKALKDLTEKKHADIYQNMARIKAVQDGEQGETA